MSIADCNTPADFAPIARREIFDALVEAYDSAKALAAGDKRWSSALDRAYSYALEVETFEYSIAHWAVRVPSASEAGVVFEANGACQCRAYTNEHPCWHRALARLIRRAIELRGEHEVKALAAELSAEAKAAGDTFYTAEIARAGARSRMEGLEQFASEWDRDVEAARELAERRKALIARIAQHRTVAAAKAA